MLPVRLPDERQPILDQIVDRFKSVRGIQALVLGGSFARGVARIDSDLDIGIYYAETESPDLGAIRDLAAQISVPDKPPTVTGLYEWGPWVNGGAWIQTKYGKVDFLYRNIQQVRRTITEAQNGITHHDFHQQPTLGFTSLIYLAETSYCIPLIDESGVIAQLKSEVAVYPEVLKTKIIRDSLWASEFTLIHAMNFANRGDVLNVVGCLAKIAFYLLQILFAANEQYYFGDKGALSEIDRFSKFPREFGSQIESVFAAPGLDPEQLTASVRVFEAIRQSVADVV